MGHPDPGGALPGEEAPSSAPETLLRPPLGAACRPWGAGCVPPGLRCGWDGGAGCCGCVEQPPVDPTLKPLNQGPPPSLACSGVADSFKSDVRLGGPGGGRRQETRGVQRLKAELGGCRCVPPEVQGMCAGGLPAAGGWPGPVEQRPRGSVGVSQGRGAEHFPGSCEQRGWAPGTPGGAFSSDACSPDSDPGLSHLGRTQGCLGRPWQRWNFLEWWQLPANAGPWDALWSPPSRKPVWSRGLLSSPPPPISQ